MLFHARPKRDFAVQAVTCFWTTRFAQTPLNVWSGTFATIIDIYGCCTDDWCFNDTPIRPVGSCDGQRLWGPIASVQEAKLVACALTSCVLRRKAIYSSLTRLRKRWLWWLRYLIMWFCWNSDPDDPFVSLYFILFWFCLPFTWNHKDTLMKHMCTKTRYSGIWDKQKKNAKIMLIQTLTERYLVFRCLYLGISAQNLLLTSQKRPRKIDDVVFFFRPLNHRLPWMCTRKCHIQRLGAHFNMEILGYILVTCYLVTFLSGHYITHIHIINYKNPIAWCRVALFFTFF